MKKTFTLVLAVLLCISFAGCKNSEASNKTKLRSDESGSQTTGVVYENPNLGFTFSLPKSWKGYTIVETTWDGASTDELQGEKDVETGPLLSIRHPEWTETNPRQDIPIMVFTLSQWNALQQDKFHIGAAPMGPSELGRNSQYVFALPARYNYAFPTGYEEVEEILKNKPLQSTKPLTPDGN